ncbi:28920_t:CDS:2, partial [Dentiscutata erythropus]
MKCKQCQVDKLSEEFPFGTISSKCEHVASWCLKCLVIYLKKTQQCPICNAILTEQEFNDYCLIWDNASFKIDSESFSQSHIELPGQNKNSGTFYVVRLNGEKFEFKLSEINTINELKHRLMNYTKIDIERQMLIYKNMKLKNDENNTLTSYGICANSHIQLIVLLYSISKGQAVKNLVFDLHWGYPDKGIDYLDGTCLIYKGNILWKVYDYNHRIHHGIPYISHSGDIMNRKKAIGHHTITAKLDNLPNDVTQIYLILSSWSSPTISHFRNQSFKLYDKANPFKQLCKYDLNEAGNSQAVIMCLINRSLNGCWNVIEIGKLSKGTARDYSPIMENIVNIR